MLIYRLMVYTLIMIMFLLYFLSKRKCLTAKKREVESWPKMNNSEFIAEIKNRLSLEDKYILKERKYLARSLWIPVNCVTPDLKFSDVRFCIIFTYFSNCKNIADYLIDELKEDYVIYGHYPNEKFQEIKIETVTDFIFYSAIISKKIEDPGKGITANKE